MDYLRRIDIVDGKVLGDQQDAFVDAISLFARHLPNITFYINMLDEPRVLRKPPVNTKLARMPYDSQRKTFRVEPAGTVLPLMEQVCSVPVQQLQKHGFFLGPGSFETTAELVPIFSSASVGVCFADIIYPSHYYLRTATSESWAEPLPVSAKVVSSWPRKKEVVYWRGTTTGGHAEEGGQYMEFHRQRLVQKFGFTGAKFGDPGYDIRFTSVLQCANGACDKERREFEPLAGWSPQSKSKDFKYLLDIDGNTFSQRYLPFLRFTGSLILKMFLFEDWLTEQTRPNEHYLPVDLDLHDLEDQVRWARENDDKARLIAMTGQIHASQRLRYDDMLCYFYRLLLEYHELTLPGVKEPPKQQGAEKGSMTK